MKPLTETLKSFEPPKVRIGWPDGETPEVLFDGEYRDGDGSRYFIGRASFEKLREVALLLAEACEKSRRYLIDEHTLATDKTLDEALAAAQKKLESK